MSRALIVGIDYYEHTSDLIGCVKDAENMARLLGEHEGGHNNFDCKVWKASDKKSAVSRVQFRKEIEELFKHPTDMALLYFAGHGHIKAAGGTIMASDSLDGSDGVTLDFILTLANNSEATNRVIILDSCYSGSAGYTSHNPKLAALAEGVTILAAATKDQYAWGDKNGGVFTNLVVDALSGGAADLLGNITVASLYAHLDKSLGDWDQRPVFKANVERFVPLRKVDPPISRIDLKKIGEYFDKAGDKFKLDPSYEPRDEARTPDMPRSNPDHVKIFKILQKFNRLNLLVPHPKSVPNMWTAAMKSKWCVLTPLGKHYHRLVKNKRL